MEYGLQLFSIRDITEKNLKQALQEVAKLGYKMVEFAGFFDHSAKEVKSILQETQLVICGTHTDWREIATDFEKLVAYHQEIGNHNIIIPWAELTCQEKIDSFIAMVNEFQPKLEQKGIALHYHNHAEEFLPNQDGSVAFTQLVERTKLLLEIDTYWVYAAKQNPTEWMEQLKDRVRFIHIKDGDINGNGKPLGQGSAPVKQVWQKACELQIPMVVESETLQPDGLTEAKVCIQYLHELEK